MGDTAFDIQEPHIKENNMKNTEIAANPHSEKGRLLKTKSEVSSCCDSKVCDELYSALDDKNRAIEILKRRLANQQIQLGYYLHKNLATEAVLEFSTKCFPHLVEDNTQLSLAMYKFIRDTGGKTRLAQLRERLNDYTTRVHKVLLRQEKLVRNACALNCSKFNELNADFKIEDEDFCMDEDEEGDVKDELRFAKRAFKNAQMQMSSKLLSVTLNIRQELEKFRICAECIVKLEEERNILVDRVFSMPVEQRYSMHMAVLDKDEHHKHASEDGDASNPTMTSVSTSTLDDNDIKEGKMPKMSIGGALKDMESEALQLLLISEKQKNEFIIALEEARTENQHLKERLRDLEEATSDERVMQLQEKCLSIESEVLEMRQKFEEEQQEKEENIKKLTVELKNKETLEKSYLQDIKKLKLTNEILRDERTSLQKRLESRTQLQIEFLNKNTNTEEKKNNNRSKIVSNSQEIQSAQEVEELTDLVILQEEQIKDLLLIMSGLNINTSRSDTSEVTTSQKDESNEQIKEIISDSIKSEEESFNLEFCNFQSMESQIYPTQKEEVPCNDKQDLDDDGCNVFYDTSSDYSNIQTNDQDNEDNLPIINTATPSETKSECENKSVRSQRNKKRYFVHSTSPKIEKHRYSVSSPLATTSLRVEAFDKDGKSESMHAVIESSSPVDGLLEMNNSSKLHLRLQCTSNQSSQRNNMSLTTINETDIDSLSKEERHVSGDHFSKKTVSSQKSRNLHLSKETKLYLTKQLNKLKMQLKEVSSNSSRKEIFHNLNEIYSDLFGSDANES